MDVVSDGQELVGGSVAGVHLSSKLVLCVLLKLWSDVVVVIRVQIEVGNMITQVCHILGAPRSIRAGGEWWAHISWEFADDVGKGHFQPHHLVVTLLLRYGAQVLMRPSVAGDLMAFVDHTSDHAGPCLRGVIETALAKIDTSDKESGLEAI